MNIKALKTLGVFLLFMAVYNAAHAQIKVGDNPTTLNPAAELEIESTNKGLLLPRVNLSTTTTWGLVDNGSNPKAGMMVYNTNASISGSAAYPAAGAGVYTFDGIGWVFNATPAGGSDGQVLTKTTSGYTWSAPASGVMSYSLPGTTSSTGMFITASGPGVTYSVNPTTQTIKINVPAGVRLISARSLETQTTTGISAAQTILRFEIETAAADGLNTSWLNATIPMVLFANFALNPKAISTRNIRYESAENNRLVVNIPAMDGFNQYLFLLNF